MDGQQLSLFLILGSTLILFVVSRWRYDAVAIIALLAAVVAGVVPFSAAFSGFSNPAVVTVAEIMIISYVIAKTGLVVYLVKQLTRLTDNQFFHIAVLCLLATLLSAFMNNIGALALLLPLAMEISRTNNHSPSFILMPLSFASILGGMTTMIGTPPNIVIANFRAEILGRPFTMFDFAPVGLGVTAVGLLFIILIGWRILPMRRKSNASDSDAFHIQDYITEVSVNEDSKLVGKPLREVEDIIKGDVIILGHIRGERKRLNIETRDPIQIGDILIVQAASSDLEKLIASTNVKLVGSEHSADDILKLENTTVIEVVVPPGSRLEGSSARRLNLRNKHKINLLAVARAGKMFNRRLYNVGLSAGDVLLLQGSADSLIDTVTELGFLPLAERGISIAPPHGAVFPLLFFAGAILITALGLLPIQISLAIAILLMMLTTTVQAKRIYESVDWSVIILLGAIIPVGSALQSTGGTTLIAQSILSIADLLPPFMILALLMVITMTLSDIMNNVATAVVMAPIAVSIALALNYNIDPFLMTIAVGSSCAFLTPIGHQNNTLVLGPGGYHFSDFWRMGLPLEILVLSTAIPLIMWVWPL